MSPLCLDVTRLRVLPCYGCRLAVGSHGCCHAVRHDGASHERCLWQLLACCGLVGRDHQLAVVEERIREGKLALLALEHVDGKLSVGIGSRLALGVAAELHLYVLHVAADAAELHLAAELYHGPFGHGDVL